MSEAIIGLIGVFMGVTVSSLSQLLIWYANSKQWQREKKLEWLYAKREDLAAAFGVVNTNLNKLYNLKAPRKLLKESTPSVELLETIFLTGATFFKLPDDVRAAYIEYVLAEINESPERIDKLSLVSSLMGEHIDKVNKEIELVFNER